MSEEKSDPALVPISMEEEPVIRDMDETVPTAQIPPEKREDHPVAVITPRSPAEVERAKEILRSGGPSGILPLKLPPPPPPPKARTIPRWPLPLALLGAAGALGALAWYLWR